MFCSKSRRNGPATSLYPQYERTRTWWFANRGKSSIIETPCFCFVKRVARCSLNRMWRHISVDDPNTKKVPGVAECSPPPLVWANDFQPNIAWGEPAWLMADAMNRGKLERADWLATESGGLAQQTRLHCLVSYREVLGRVRTFADKFKTKNGVCPCEGKGILITILLFQKQEDQGSGKLVGSLQFWLYKRADKREKYQVPGLWCLIQILC